MSNHVLAAAQAAEIVALSNELDQAKNDSDFWHKMYENSQNQITELKARMIVQEGDKNVPTEL